MRDQQALLTARWGLVAYGRPPWRGATSARGRGDAAVSMKGIAREKPKAMTYICWDQPWRTEEDARPVCGVGWPGRGAN